MDRGLFPCTHCKIAARLTTAVAVPSNENKADSINPEIIKNNNIHF